MELTTLEYAWHCYAVAVWKGLGMSRCCSVPRRGNTGTISGMSSEPESSIKYGPVVSSTWHDEGGVKLPAWYVKVDFGSHETTFWFQSEHGANIFVENRPFG